jgi:phosphate starvation-inducible protein PhoH and related proteins
MVSTTTKTLVHGVGGKKIQPKTKDQESLVSMSQDNDIVFALGPAGTGKTYIAVALAVKALKDKIVSKIILTRPAVEAGESLGFLPGDLKEKVDPYLRPLYDALEDMIPQEKIKQFKESRVIEVSPLAFMRGRTLDDAFVILDEAQNTTDAQLKMFLTRLGPNAKCLITGDMSQVDLPRRQTSGLIKAKDILMDIPGIAFCEMSPEGIVRHALVKKIVIAYSKNADS